MVKHHLGSYQVITSSYLPYIPVTKSRKYFISRNLCGNIFRSQTRYDTDTQEQDLGDLHIGDLFEYSNHRQRGALCSCWRSHYQATFTAPLVQVTAFNLPSELRSALMAESCQALILDPSLLFVTMQVSFMNPTPLQLPIFLA